MNKTSTHPSSTLTPSKGKWAFSAVSIAVVIALIGIVCVGFLQLQNRQKQEMMQADIARLGSEQHRQFQQLGEVRQVSEPLQQQIHTLQQQNSRHQRKIDLLSRRVQESQGDGRTQWQLAEAEFLLRLANQRLLMSRDVYGAKRLLQEADGQIHEIDDYGLYSVRQALAEDIAALNAVPDYDQESIYLKMQAMISQIPELPLLNKGLLDKESETSALSVANDQPISEHVQELAGWYNLLHRAAQRIWNSVTGLFRFTADRSEPVEPLLTPQQDSLIRQNLQLMLEQAQLALLTGHGTIYKNSLEQSVQWLQRYFSLGGQAPKALIKNIKQLSVVPVEPGLPDINRALNILKNYQPDSELSQDKKDPEAMVQPILNKEEGRP